MAEWQQIWRGQGARDLWSIPDRHVVNVVREWQAVGTIRRVLDVGCGLGRHVGHLVREGFDVYGCDPSDRATTACQRELQAHGLAAEIRCGEVDALPYPDGFFDAVLAFNSLYHGTSARVSRSIDALHRTLRAGGACFATLPSHANRMYGKGEMVEAHTFISPGMFGQVFDSEAERGVCHHFSSEEEVHGLFRGFRIASLEHEELELVRPAHGSRPATPLRIPRAYFWHVRSYAK